MSMKVLFAASEAVPLAKSGGLADVVGSLPKSLAAQGVDVRVVLPYYSQIPAFYKDQFTLLGTVTVQLGWRKQYCGLLQAEIEGMVYYALDNEYYFARDSLYGYGDEAERFVFFCFAVLDSLPYMEFVPDIIHCHDWQTGLIPFLLKTRYAYEAPYGSIRTLFTIHNLKYQGVFGSELLSDLLGSDGSWLARQGLEFYGALNCMKAGLLFADKLSTVSEAYAQEIQGEYYGEQLDGVLRMRSADLAGILNGIDYASFNPMKDEAIDMPYKQSLAKKQRNKLALQEQLGLHVSADTPLIGIVSRLVEQKGLDLIEAILEPLLAEDVQLAVLGTGEHRFEELFRWASGHYAGKLAIRTMFDDSLARRIYAGSDMYLMPSRFEPCGLSQLIALRYCSVPIVRETGGLRDTVQSYNEYTGEGNGFSFTHYEPEGLLHTIRRALHYYRDPAAWKTIVANGSKQDYSWKRSAQRYKALYQALTDI